MINDILRLLIYHSSTYFFIVLFVVLFIVIFLLFLQSFINAVFFYAKK